MRRWKYTGGVILCLVCLTLIGCAARINPRSTSPTIKIGLVAPFERRHRSLGYEVLYAVKWAVRQRNEAGGVGGAMIELVALNDNAAPDESATQAYKFAADPGVVGVIGPFSAPSIAAAAPVYGDLGLSAITPDTCPANVRDTESVFCLGASIDDLAAAMIARLPPGARVTLLREPDGLLTDALAPAAQHTIEGPWMEHERKAAADVYLYDGDVLTAAEKLIEMRAAGIDAPLWGGPSLARTQLPQVAGDAVRGACYAITAPRFANLSQGSAFAAGYHEMSGRAPGPWATLAYDAVELLLDAIERAIQAEGQATRASVIEQLAEERAFSGSREVVLYCYERDDMTYPGHITD